MEIGDREQATPLPLGERAPQAWRRWERGPGFLSLRARLQRRAGGTLSSYLQVPENSSRLAISSWVSSKDSLDSLRSRTPRGS